MKINLKSTLLLTLLAVTTVAVSGCTSTDSNSGSGDKTEQKDKNSVAYKNVAKDGSITIGKDGVVPADKVNNETPTLDVYLDPLCPGCGAFETATHEYLSEQIKSGAIQVRYFPLMFLNEYSADEYSSRTAAYMAGVAEHAPESFEGFFAKVMDIEFQPGEGSDYVSVPNSKLDEIAKEFGADEAAIKKINDDLNDNQMKAYDNTLRVMKDQSLVAQSPQGSIYTPFVIPKESGKNKGTALTLATEDLLQETKDAVEKITK